MQPTNLESKALEVENAPDSAPSDRKVSVWRFLSEVKTIFKENGFKGVLKKYGWKVLTGFFLYYLVRDTIIYLVIPYLIAKGIF